MISEILDEWHLLGIVSGLATFLIIGLFHPVVIKCEYYFGVKCCWWFVVFEVVMCTCSYFIDDIFLSIVCGVTGFSSFWTVKEIFDQRERVRKGWFPANPKRKS